MSIVFWNGRRVAGRCPRCGSKRITQQRGPIGELIAVCIDCERDAELLRRARAR